ncbi:MAG TPA: argininosuccinate lyase, partial [Candidatus Eisenbacteria bacterium]|nr:argininosuccinate lyase [Candidatus Eisenbacteria bacterium]
MAEVWRGRLTALDPRAERLNRSLAFDVRLWPEELALTRAYAGALVQAGVLDEAGARALLQACGSLERDLESGAATLAGEDVHSGVEAALGERCGEPARRLHTGRSRNDQVATLLRLRVMRLADEAVEGVRALERALVAQARASGDRAVAAYTHLQPAQPVLLAHWWLAHASAFERDEARFEAARESADCLPLGAGAIAGTPLVYDRLALAARLGFSRVAANSIDAVGDRDFALDYLNAAATLGLHMSRLAEDLVLLCSPGFGWFAAPDGFSTGSSLLPQKRNPDLFELARGKSARLLANAQRLSTVLKGLPSAYQKDLQEDKEAVFDTADTLEALLAVLPDAIAALHPRDEALAHTLTPDLLAVELADALVAEGVPFRDAHAAVGRLWATAERAGVAPAELPESARLAISPLFTAERLGALSVESALARRAHEPGTGAANVAAQLERFEARLGVAGTANA